MNLRECIVHGVGKGAIHKRRDKEYVFGKSIIGHLECLDESFAGHV
jgi:hypothetical protein